MRSAALDTAASADPMPFDANQRFFAKGDERAGYRLLPRRFPNRQPLQSAAVRTLAAAHDCRPSSGAAWFLRQPCFVALVVAEPGQILQEHYAADFAPKVQHPLLSASKIVAHALIGDLIAEGKLARSDCVEDVLPGFGGPFGHATVGAILDMRVDLPELSESDIILGDSAAQEAAWGWHAGAAPRLADYLAALRGQPGPRRTAYAYRSTNTDLLVLLASHVSPEPLAARLARYADAIGLESLGQIGLSTDGLPLLSIGVSLTARDFARLGLWLLERGTLAAAVERGRTEGETRRFHYVDHVQTNGHWAGHIGYGGQFLMVDPVRHRVAVCYNSMGLISGLPPGTLRHYLLRMQRLINDPAIVSLGVS